MSADFVVWRTRDGRVQLTIEDEQTEFRIGGPENDGHSVRMAVFPVDDGARWELVHFLREDG